MMIYPHIQTRPSVRLRGSRSSGRRGCRWGEKVWKAEKYFGPRGTRRAETRGGVEDRERGARVGSEAGGLPLALPSSLLLFVCMGQIL